MTKCATYLSIFSEYKTLVTSVVTYANTVATSAALTTAMTNLNAITSAQTGWVAACMSTPAPAPAKTDDKKRVLQAIVPAKPTGPSVEHDDWNWWVKQNVTRSMSAKASPECLASTGIQDLVNNWVFFNKDAEFNYFVVYYKALDAAFKAVGDKTAQKKWTSFKGTKLLDGKGSSKTDKKPDTKKPDTKKPDTKKPDTKKPDTKKPDTKKPDTKKPDTKKSGGEIMANGFLPPLKTLNVLASAFAPKGSKKKVATGGASKRRAQAVQPAQPTNGKATITISTTGVDLNTSQNTFAGASSSDFSGDGQGELSGNLLKFASTLVLSLLVLLY
jgi:hypothetical protein